uniref:EXPERA domain-containing protein n=1 Tax=Vannella robusta TaxID=1487602 RepID=A0A7S4IGQ5_9EUKA|mmetsp:Transcript_25613/g.32639  ORF Transcript_25613/g.32639 Transcript_25613/m.32639 type:complete len:216 (+) Transcript_25613:3-650(+)
MPKNTGPSVSSPSPSLRRRKKVNENKNNEERPKNGQHNKQQRLVWERFVHVSSRPVDWILIIYFFFAFMATYFFAIQQASGIDFNYPRGIIYPPSTFVEIMIWWGRTYNPLCLTNPLFYRTIQTINVALAGPFFLFAMINFISGHNWIRLPTLIWSSCNLYSLVIIVTEEFATAEPSAVLLYYYAAHFFVSLLAFYRSWKPFPFGGYLRLVHDSR